jgi:hypothetical protein
VQTIRLKPDLDDYDDLVRRVEQWIPPDTKRTSNQSTAERWIIPLAVGNAVLMVLAFSVQTRAIPVPLCLIEAPILAGCFVIMWHTNGSGMRWAAPYGIIPILL